jgi:PadR family transcriptional regulator, regulatory protein PadR
MQHDYIDNWTVQVRKGLLDVCILRAMADKERYGFELVKTLADVPGLGLTEGTLYPLLSRLRVQGLVSTRLEESSEGPARKYYTLTAEGRRVLKQMEDFMDTLNAGTRSLRRKGAAACPPGPRWPAKNWTNTSPASAPPCRPAGPMPTKSLKICAGIWTPRWRRPD